MSGFVWKDVKRDVCDALAGHPALAGRRYAYSVRKISPPAFIVYPPERVEHHGTYDGGQGGVGRLWAARFPLLVAVGSADQESAEETLSDFTAEEGALSVINALERHRAPSYSVLTVMTHEPVVVSIGGTEYLGALFSSDVVGGGA